MGYSFDLTTPGGSSTGLPKKSVPMRAAPVQSTWSQPEAPASSFGRIDLTDAAVTGIQMAATAPGYIYERPLAALNTIGKSKPTDKGFIDQAGDTIRNIPVLGDLLSGGAQAVSNTIEGSGRIFPALANSWVATALNDNYGRGENEKVSGVAATLINFNPDMTVGELRQYAAQRGFTPDDELNIHTGKSGIFDFSDKAMSTNPLLDLGGRMVIDPLNVIAFGGAGALAKGVIKGASLGGKIFDGTTMMSRIDKLATGAKALEDAVGLSRTGFKSTVAGMRALRAGDISGVTLNTFGRHLAMMSRGSSDFLRAYRKVAIGATGAQLGLQELAKSGITDNTPLSPIMDSLYEAADRMAEDKPLSEGMLFNLWAAVNFPIRDGLSDAWQSTRANGLGIGIGKATLRTPLLRRITDIEKYVVKELAPGKSFKDGRAYLIGRFGSEDRFQDHIMHFTRSLVTEDPNTAMPALTNQPATTAEFQATAEANNRVWDAATRARVESGEIDGRAVFEHMRDKYRGTRSTSTNRTGGETEVTGRVARDWDPEDHIRQWNDWADRMEALNLKAGFQKGGNLVIGIMDGLMPKEHLVAAKRTLEAIAGPDGIIPKNRMDEFLNAFPALDADVNDPGNFFARLRAPDSGEVSKGAAVQRVERLLKDPRTMTMREYLYGVEQMQKRAESIKTKRGTVLDENGMPDPTRAPDIGQAAVLTPTLKDSVRRQMGLDGLTLEDVHASRGEARTRAIEDDVAAVIDESGFNLRAAVQGIVSRGGKKVTALSLHLDSKTDVGSLELAGAIALRRTGADRATILYSGAESLTTHGLTANAAHTRFDIGKMSSDEAARVLDAAVEAFDGQFELNDTAGVLHVVVKPGQEDAVQALTDLIDGVVGRDRVSVSHEPAWFQVIRNDMRSGGRGRATAGESSARAIWDAARGDLRLVNSERKFSERAIRSAEYATATSKGARDARGVLGEARPGFARGPEAARAGRDGLGANEQGRVVVPSGFTANSSEVRVRRGSDQALNNPDPDGGMYHATTALSKVLSEGLRSRRQTGRTGLGGAEFEDDLSFKNKISITYRRDFAEAIAERFRMAARAARGEVTPEEVYAYFAPRYTRFPLESLEDFKASWPEDGYGQAYRIKELDDGLYSEPGQTGVGMTNIDGIARLDPDEIGIVQVAIRGDVPVVHKGGEFELKVNPREVHVIQRTGSDGLGPDQQGGLKATRYGSPADVSKPQGAYMSLDGDLPSAHAELGDGTQYTVRARNPIDVTDSAPPGASAGVRYLSTIGELDDLASTGGVEFGQMFVKSRGTADGKAALLEQMSQRFPDVEWGRYKDSYEILEAYAGLRARANGHDVIINRDPVDPSFDEVVVLDGRAISDIPDAFRPEDSSERMGMRHLFWDELAGNPIPTEGPPPFDIRETIDFARASDGVPEGSFRDPVIQAHDASGSQGQVVFLAEADDALEALTPRLTADLGGEGRTDLGGLDPVQIEKIKGLETELRQYDPQYRIKIAPTQGNVATYYPGQGNAIKDLMATSRAASDLLTFKRWGKAAAFWDLMFRPVQTSKLGDEAKQALYRELLGRTAHLPDDKTIRIKDIDSFLQTANAAARQNRILGAQTYARGELLDIKTLTAIADGSFSKDLTNNTGGIFQGFTPEALAAIGGAKHIHKILDRTGSRFFRDLEKRTRGTPARPREMSAKDLTDWQVSYYAKDGPEWVDVYHGTSNAKTLLKDGRFKLGPGGFDVLNTGEHRGSVFLTPDPTYARQFAGYGKSAGVQHPDPDVVRVQVRRGTGVVNGSELVIPIGQAGPQNVRIVGRASETRGDKGQLGRVMAETYGGVRSKTATPRHYIRTWYHLFRFTFDPRFHVMNHAEADMLGLMKYGHSTTRWGGARKEGVGKDGATQAHSRGGDMNADRLADALASGVLDARHLEGYIGRGFQVDRVRSTREVLRTLADEDPAAQALRREFGGTVDEWVDGLEETMYSFDTKGVDETITEAMAGILDEADRVAMEPLLIRLYERNRQIFKDVKSTFHGNTNRSNIERIMNSYFLYWPISYQLKAGKWLFDVLTKQSLGRKTNLGGAWYVNNLYQQHMERMARDETYQRIFTDNPALWFTASMLLPMTPWDMSAGMSRATRYMLAGVGIIDEPKFEEDPFMAAMRLAHIGPAYTIELAERMYRESKDRPRDLVVPVN